MHLHWDFGKAGRKDGTWFADLGFLIRGGVEKKVGSIVPAGWIFVEDGAREPPGRESSHDGRAYNVVGERRDGHR
jgi:hypothetical protein